MCCVRDRHSLTTARLPGAGKGRGRAGQIGSYHARPGRPYRLCNLSHVRNTGTVKIIGMFLSILHNMSYCNACNLCVSTGNRG